MRQIGPQDSQCPRSGRFAAFSGQVAGLLDSLNTIDRATLNAWIADLDPLPDLSDLLFKAIEDEPPVSLREGQLIKPGFDSQVDQLRSAAQDGKQWIIDLESRERERTGIRSLKVGYNRVFGFYLEVTRSNLAQVPEDYLRKQTLANGERYVTPELKEMEDTILGAEQKAIALEYDLFCSIREQVNADLGESSKQPAPLLVSTAWPAWPNWPTASSIAGRRSTSANPSRSIRAGIRLLKKCSTADSLSPMIHCSIYRTSD